MRFENALEEEWKAAKRIDLEMIGMGKNFFWEIFSKLCAGRIKIETNDTFLEKADDHLNALLDALCGIISEEEFEDFIRTEKMEETLLRFSNNIAKKAREIIEWIGKTSFRINETLLFNEIKRRELLAEAQISHNLELLHHHQNQVDDMINQAEHFSIDEEGDLLHPQLIVALKPFTKFTIIQIIFHVNIFKQPDKRSQFLPHIAAIFLGHVKNDE